MGKNIISRVNRSKQQARMFYNHISRWYNLLAGASERKHIDSGLKMLAVKEGERTLETGFGTGYAILSLARAAGSGGKVFGIDISDGMFKTASSAVRSSGLSSRVELLLGDAARLPFEDGSFDALFASFTLELFDTPELPAILKEWRRVLKNGGRICVVGLSKESPNFWVGLYEWAHRLLPSLIDCRPIFVKKLMEQAGFLVKKTEIRSMWGLPVETVLAIK